MHSAITGHNGIHVRAKLYLCSREKTKDEKVIVIVIVELLNSYNYVTSVREEDEALFRIAVIETGLLHIIIIMDDVGLVFVFRRAAHMINNTKTFRSFHGPLERSQSQSFRDARTWHLR